MPSETATLPSLTTLAAQPKIRVLLLSAAGLLLLWFAPAAVWGAMPAWLVVTAFLYRRGRSDDWLMLPVAGLPFWWATGLFQYAVPILAGIGVIGAVLADPIRGRLRETWRGLGVEKWFALAAFASMLPSVLAVSGGGRMFTYARTVGLTGAGLAAMLLVVAIARIDDVRSLLAALIGFAGLLGLWTLAQLVFKGTIHLPLQRTASVMKALPGRAGVLAARDVSEIVGIKYENIGGGKLVVRPNAFFVHAVATGAIAGLMAPLLWRRIRSSPVLVAVVTALFSGLIGAALVASLARGAFIGIAGAIAGGVVVFWPHLRRVQWRRRWPSFAIAGVVLACVVLPLFNNAKAREESDIGKTSYASRAAYYRATLKAIPEDLLFGHGTQRDNLAAPLVVSDGTKPLPVQHNPDGTQQVTTTWGCVDGSGGCRLVFKKFPNGVLDKLYYDKAGALRNTVEQSPDRDPPLGSHSTILGVGYKYGVIGLAAFGALWLFVGIRPLRELRSSTAPVSSDARALWIGVLAFGLQLPIYEYDYDSTSPYLFYLLCGILLGLALHTLRPVPAARS